MIPLHVRRGGTYYRVCDPSWVDPSDTSFSKTHGGRWNVAGEFGALYLNATLVCAAANARRSIEREFGNAITFLDLRPEHRPDVQTYTVTKSRFVDALTEKGTRALGLPDDYPQNCTRETCSGIASDLYAAHEPGVAARSAALASQEELAIFDTHVRLARRTPMGRLSFADWYPGLG